MIKIGCNHIATGAVLLPLRRGAPQLTDPCDDDVDCLCQGDRVDIRTQSAYLPDLHRHVCRT